ncbi:reverse transcriptase family protein [Aquabacterium sp. A7-Y]|uniref:reverse transcriptase family protein n=1 Tax=Aquabacterium sp. A7-Y TaxID=1349605 RepID=UPI00223D682C|nr:reverse transcriptase family protein [Aquabacterium sp. A7-Y]MCW7536812.1 reverse transcriptase family protein [Aquabacterium sp. A7-Y]
MLARIRASSKDAVVLAEMQRLGFWPADSGAPTLEAALIEREVELVKALDGLQAELRVKGDPEAALKAMRKERMAKAREQREATAQARERRRHERALRWYEARKTDAGYLGAGVSGGLQPAQDAPRRQLHAGLPPLESPLELAQAMGITLAELKFLCFHREVARTTHYRRFMLPKKTGGQRTISAPMPRLKRAQYWVLDNLLAKVPCHAAAHGFMPGRSIVTNAAPHCGKPVVVNLDLKDFFPSVTYPRIKGVFRSLGYDERLASVLALLCSENACDELEVDGERFFVGGKGRDRVLPQGAPTSPMLTNILCRKLDRRLQGLADKLGFTYTRYADDLTFSASAESAGLVGRLLRQVHHVLQDEGFTPHPDKQRVMRSGSRQEVTGVVVNEKPSVSRRERRKLRAALHHAQRRGLEAATWQGQPATRETLVGYARFVQMVDPRQGAALLPRALALPRGEMPARPAFADRFRRQSAQGEVPTLARGAWWEPAEAPVPELALTAGQMKAARQERINAEREARNAARKPARAGARSSASSGLVARDTISQDAATSETPTPHAPVRWWQYAIQLFIVVRVAAGMESALVFMLGMVWVGYSMMSRKTGWLRFAMAMIGIALIASIIDI